MEKRQEEAKVEIIDGVEITTEGNTVHFRIIEEDDSQIEKKKNGKRGKSEERSPWYEKAYGWLKRHGIVAWFASRDFADPFGERDDFDKGSDGKTGYEAGFKISF